MTVGDLNICDISLPASQWGIICSSTGKWKQIIVMCLYSNMHWQLCAPVSLEREILLEKENEKYDSLFS